MLSTLVWRNPEVHRIEVPYKNIALSATNCYAVRSDGEWLIVDTGAPSDEAARYLLSALDELGVDRTRASFFLTHLHLDHAGLINRIAPAGTTVYLNESDFGVQHSPGLDAYTDMLRERLVSEGLHNEEARLYSDLANDVAVTLGADHDFRFVKEGDEVRVGKTAFSVLDLAGHTEGHLGLFDPASRIAFTGDHVLFGISPSIGVFSTERDSVQAYLSNLRKTIELDASRLFHSHGELRCDFDKRAAWLIEHTERRAQTILDNIAAHPGISGIDAFRTTKWRVPFDRWEDIPLPQRSCILLSGCAYLDHLAFSGKARREALDGTRRYWAMGE